MFPAGSAVFFATGSDSANYYAEPDAKPELSTYTDTKIILFVLAGKNALQFYNKKAKSFKSSVMDPGP